MFPQVLTLVSFVLLNAAMAVPVRQKRSTTDSPWINPCVSNEVPGGQVLPPGLPPPPTLTPPSVKELIQSFRYRIDDTATKSDNLKQAMFTEWLDSSLQLASAYDSLHIEGFPLISEIEEWTSSNDTTKVVKASYKSLSKILVFLLQTLDDLENDTSTVKTHIEDTINYINDSLCTLHNLLYCLNESIDSHVTRDVMPQSQREIIIRAQRKQRDYIIAKDTTHFLFSLKYRYISILSHM